MFNRKLLWNVMSLLVLFSMFVAGCAPAAAPAPATEAPAAPVATEAPVVTEAPAAPANDYAKVGPELVDAFAGKYKGTTVTMDGPNKGTRRTPTS